MTLNLEQTLQTQSSFMEPIQSIFKIAPHIKIEHNIHTMKEREEIHLGSQRCCIECGNTSQWVNDDLTGDVICGNCGLVLAEKQIDCGKEWRSYDMKEEASRSRVGPKRNIFMYDGGLSTTIGNSCYDSRGRNLSPNAMRLQRRLRRTHSRFKTTGTPDRNFSDAMSYLNVFTQTFNLSTTIKQEVAYRYKRIVKDQSLKGRTIRNILLALIYIIRAEKNFPLPVSEVCEKGDITEKELTSYRKKVYKALKIKLLPITADKYLNTLHLTLNLDNGTALKLSRLLYKRLASLDPLAIQGKDPTGVAAGIYYLACFILNYDCTQNQIREVLYVTDVTVRNRYREASKTIFQSDFNVLRHLRKIVNTSTMTKKETQQFIHKLFSKTLN